MIPAAHILLRLLIVHLLGDFFLQPRTWVDHRNTYHYLSNRLYIHSALHAFMAWMAVGDLALWQVPLIIFITHFLMDLYKSYRHHHQTSWFVVDQAVHFLVIIGLWKWLFAPEFTFGLPGYLSDVQILTIFTAVLFLTLPSAVFIGIATRRWRKKVEQDKKKTLKDAGMWIGIIERLLVFLFALSGQYEAVGFLLAAKSIFRFGDLRKAKEKNQTEYLMIGSLLSFGIAVLISVLVRHIVC